MDVNRLTQKSQEALQGAQTKATRFGHTEVDGEHLLSCVARPARGLALRLLSRPPAPTRTSWRWRWRPSWNADLA